MNNEPETLTIGALAAAAGVGVETIRFYQHKGLLPQPRRRPGSVRRYGQDELARLRFIKSGQRIGFSLDEIAQLLRIEDGTHCREARVIAAHKLADIRQRLDDLRRMETALAALVARCGTHRGKVSCPLISALQASAVSMDRAPG